MELKVFSLRDTKGGVYHQPFYQRSHGEAERSIKQLANDPQSMVSKYPEDYDLYYLGTYDDQTGVIKPEDSPQHVLKAVQLVNTNQ